MKNVAFENKPARKITPPNCSNPDGLREKIVTSKATGEIFRYVWNNGWEIYDRMVPA